MKKTGVKLLREDKQQVKGDLMLKKRKEYILMDEKLRVEIIQLHYNVLVAGHEERWKTTKLVTRNYQWPEVTKDVEKYVGSCNIY